MKRCIIIYLYMCKKYMIKTRLFYMCLRSPEHTSTMCYINFQSIVQCRYLCFAHTQRVVIPFLKIVRMCGLCSMVLLCMILDFSFCLLFLYLLRTYGNNLYYIYCDTFLLKIATYIYYFILYKI